MRIAAAVLAAVGLVAGAVVFAASPAGAGSSAIIEVTTTADVVDGGDGVTSLREAFDLANAGPAAIVRIDLEQDATYQLTACDGSADEDDNASGDLDVTRGFSALALQGNGATVEQTCADQRVVQMVLYTELRLEDVTITGGDTPNSGGGVLAAANGLRLDHARLVDNHAGHLGGGALVGAGGTVLSMEHSTLRDNSAGTAGGGIASNNGFTITRSTIAGNQADDAAAAFAIFGTLTVLDSTITANTAVHGAGVSAAEVELVRSTLADNASGTGGSVGTADLDATMSVIAPASGMACSIAGSTSGGHNHVTDATCGLSSTGDVEDGPDPLLGPLSDGGGPTLTRAPQPGSPLLGAVPAAAADCEQTDQRGVGRPQGGACEIGAVELPLPFVDVGTAHPFFGDIVWMDAQGISTGYGDDTYRPALAVTRQAMSAFMYRLVGEPPFEPDGETFTDVPESHPFYDEIEWMAAEGISTGYPGGTYRPGLDVTRMAMSAFMYRLVGEPPFEPDGETFTDVPESHPFYDEIEWTAAAGISTGFSDSTYRPSIAVTRQAMSAFMHRLSALLML